MKRIILFGIIILLVGCAYQTKPNISALYRVPYLETRLPPLPAKSTQLTQQPLTAEVQSLLERLYAIDPVLSMEVGMLPEFQGKVGERQILSLNRFIDLIFRISPEEKSNLDELLQVGRSKVRRYCAPLQAIFWLLEEEAYSNINLLKFPLNFILSSAWDFNENSRWSDFEIVTDRLNSPELINYYEKANFRYHSHRRCPGYDKGIFESKSGCCKDYTAFSEYCLRKAGYNAWAIKVKSPTVYPYHVVCEYEDKDGINYIMDVDCYSCSGGRGILEKKEYTEKLPQIGFGYQ